MPPLCSEHPSSVIGWIRQHYQRLVLSAKRGWFTACCRVDGAKNTGLNGNTRRYLAYHIEKQSQPQSPARHHLQEPLQRHERFLIGLTSDSKSRVRDCLILPCLLSRAQDLVGEELGDFLVDICNTYPYCEERGTASTEVLLDILDLI